MEFKELGDWCKWLEKNFSNEIMIPTLPVIIRLDGNNFHNWTKGLQRPFDENLNKLMIETTKYLVKETNAVIGYTQSDEITLILWSNKRSSAIYHEGKKQKILSKLTGKCVSFFNQKRVELLPKHNKIANFDCRIYQTPTLQDATTQLLWREIDATRNSIQMLGHHYFSDKELFKLNTSQIQDKLVLEKNINWNDLESKYKKGSYIKRVVTTESFKEEELSQLPKNHNARKNPNLVFERSIIKEIEYPIFSKIQNRVNVVFYDHTPEVL
jgi:tRNA(His) guanylyltransferase